MKTHVCIKRGPWVGNKSQTIYPGPIYNEEVTVSGTVVTKCSGMAYSIEEYPNSLPYATKHFREIQPPLDITALIKECKTEKVKI